MLVVYGIVAAFAFGLLMNMSSWPFTLGIEVPGHDGWALVRARAPRWRRTCTASASTRC